MHTLELIANNPSITIDELSAKLGKTTRTIANYLKKLKLNEVILRKGPNLGGYWEIIDKKIWDDNADIEEKDNRK